MYILTLENNSSNLFQHIEYFKEVPNIDDYYNEFLIKFHSKKLTSLSSSIYSSEGLEGLGKLFNLKSEEWLNDERLFSEVEKIVIQETKKTTHRQVTEDIEKDGSNKTNTSDDDYMVAFDSIEDIKQGSTSKEDSSITSETATNVLEDVSSDTIEGFDDLRIHAIMKVLEDDDYRINIYRDIVDLITLQIF